MDPLIGRSLAQGRYRIVSLIASGAMGKVYRAYQLPLEREVALKVLRKGHERAPEFADAFEREARAASLIQHPNSVQVLDFGRDKRGHYFIAMELVRGASLQAWLAKTSRPPVSWTVSVMSQVLAGVAAAHDRGVVHRDVKPENILVMRTTADDGGYFDLVKVCDFGIAKSRAAGTAEMGGERTVCGTPEYMAPEQVCGEPLDQRTDVYACGVVLFQMLTGRLPFEADGPVETARMQVTEPVPRPSHWCPDIDPGVEAVVLRALQKRPEARFAGAREMRAALLTALAGQRRKQVAAQRVRRAPALLPGTQRRGEWGRGVMLWAGLLLATVGTLGHTMQGQGADVAKESAVQLPPLESVSHWESAEGPRSPEGPVRAELVSAVASGDGVATSGRASDEKVAVDFDAPSQPKVAEDSAKSRPVAPARTVGRSSTPKQPPQKNGPREPVGAPMDWAAAAHVAIDSVQVRGRLSATVVRRATWQRLAGFRACYETVTQRRGQRDREQVELWLRLDEGGAVTIARARASTLPELAACVGREARRIPFDADAELGAVEAQLVLTFQ